MRAPISVVIPTLNAAKTLPACLGALGAGLEAGLIRELIISDGGSSDGTLEIAAGAGARVVQGDAGRGGQLARGCDAAQGHWLLTLHADTILLEGWSQATLEHLVHHPQEAGYFQLAFAEGGVPGRLVAGWANWRARRLKLPYGDQALLISRELYDSVGGYAEIPLMEDVRLARLLGRRLRALDATALTSAERYIDEGWLRRGGRNLGLLARYLAGADPERLAARYRRRR
jgi:rSAM/selenodomain-associated transferase 2